MYVKIVKYNGKSKVGRVETTREAKTFSHEVRDNMASGELELVLTIDGEEFTYDENTSVSVYVMSDTGRTIDKVEWDYLEIHPEILA